MAADTRASALEELLAQARGRGRGGRGLGFRA